MTLTVVFLSFCGLRFHVEVLELRVGLDRALHPVDPAGRDVGVAAVRCLGLPVERGEPPAPVPPSAVLQQPPPVVVTQIDLGLVGLKSAAPPKKDRKQKDQKDQKDQKIQKDPKDDQKMIKTDRDDPMMVRRAVVD